MVKNPPAMHGHGDAGLILGWRRSPGEGNGYPFQHSCLENSMDMKSLAGYSPQGHRELDTAEQLTLTIVD